MAVIFQSRSRFNWLKYEKKGEEHLRRGTVSWLTAKCLAFILKDGFHIAQQNIVQRNRFQTAQTRFSYDLRIGIPALHKRRHGKRTASRTRQISPNFTRNRKECSSSVGSASSSMAPETNCYAYGLKHTLLETELFPVSHRRTCKHGISATSSIQPSVSQRRLASELQRYFSFYCIVRSKRTSTPRCFLLWRTSHQKTHGIRKEIRRSVIPTTWRHRLTSRTVEVHTFSFQLRTTSHIIVSPLELEHDRVESSTGRGSFSFVFRLFQC